MWPPAGRPVLRGSETASAAMSGFDASAFSSASTPSSASATTLIPSWRSSSMRRPERTMPWSSAIRMWSTRASLWDVEPDTRSAPRRRTDSQLSSDESRALGHSRETNRAAVGACLRVEALAVVAHTQLEAVRGEHAQVEVDEGGPGVLGGVRQGLLDDAVDDGLLVLV